MVMPVRLVAVPVGRAVERRETFPEEAAVPLDCHQSQGRAEWDQLATGRDREGQGAQFEADPWDVAVARLEAVAGVTERHAALELPAAVRHPESPVILAAVGPVGLQGAAACPDSLEHRLWERFRKAC